MSGKIIHGPINDLLLLGHRRGCCEDLGSRSVALFGGQGTSGCEGLGMEKDNSQQKNTLFRVEWYPSHISAFSVIFIKPLSLRKHV